MWRRIPRVLTLTVRLFALLLIVGNAVFPAEAPSMAEHQIKALYLFNFTKYVEWPHDAFTQSDAPFAIGIAGSPEIRRDLMEISAEKMINGRKLVIRSIDQAQDVKTCQIIFVGSGYRQRLGDFLSAAQDLPVLTVSETEAFLDLGGAINFTRKENKVRLEINLTATQRARLVLSAKLLAVAEVIRGKQESPKN